MGVKNTLRRAVSLQQHGSCITEAGSYVFSLPVGLVLDLIALVKFNTERKQLCVSRPTYLISASLGLCSTQCRAVVTDRARRRSAR